MVPELVVLAVEYYRAPLRYRHLVDPNRPLPRHFSRLISELGSALSAQNREITAHTLGVAPQELERAVGFFLRDVLLAPGADHYRVLGLTRQCPPEAVRQHYQLLVGVFHPDRSTTDAERDAAFTARLNDAYNILRSPEKRALYDEQTSQNAAVSDADIDDRDFFRSLPSIRPFLGAGATPPAARRFPAPRAAAIWALAAFALGLILLFLLRPSPPPPPRASLDLLNQPAPRPAYLAQPEAAKAPRGQRPNESRVAEQQPVGAEPAVSGNPPAPLASPSETTGPLELAQPDPLPTASRDAIRAAALEGRELPPATPQPVSPNSRSGARPTTADHQLLPEPRSIAEGATAPKPPEAMPGSTPPSLADTRPPNEPVPRAGSEQPAATAESSSPESVAATAISSEEQAPVTAAERPLATKAQTHANGSATTATESANHPGSAREGNATAPAVPENAAPLPEAPPSPNAAPAKDSTAATSEAPEKPSRPKPEPPARSPSGPAEGSRLAAEHSPEKPAIEQRPKGPPPLSPTDVVNRLMHAYQSGDLNGLMSLFTANAQINGGGGAAHIRSRYADMFSRLPERRLSVQNLSWRKGRGDRLIGSGVVQVSARTGPQSSWGHAAGTITFELASTVGGYRIAKMIHRLE